MRRNFLKKQREVKSVPICHLWNSHLPGLVIRRGEAQVTVHWARGLSRGTNWVCYFDQTAPLTKTTGNNRIL